MACTRNVTASYKRAKYVWFDVYRCSAEAVPKYRFRPFGGLAEQAVIPVQAVRYLALND